MVRIAVEAAEFTLSLCSSASPQTVEAHSARALDLVQYYSSTTTAQQQQQGFTDELQLLETRTRVCDCRSLFAKAKYIEACSKWIELCGSSSSRVLGATRDALHHAIACAVCAARGPGRTRLLSVIGGFLGGRAAAASSGGYTTDSPFSNERLQKLARLVSRLHAERFLDMATSDEKIRPLQSLALLASSLVSLSDPTTMSQPPTDIFTEEYRKAEQLLLSKVQEHNLLCACRLYSSVRLRDLAILNLGSVEKLAVKLINDGRINGSIDQESDLIYFHESQSEGDATAASLLSTIDDCAQRIKALRLNAASTTC
ncbi:unnamed protein product [Amoebophrya sp. A25]|nr:unnamed protein product [Amoebophrya sp. A25]|eukprot:GSA25T00022079001.1